MSGYLWYFLQMAIEMKRMMVVIGTETGVRDESAERKWIWT